MNLVDLMNLADPVDLVDPVDLDTFCYPRCISWNVISHTCLSSGPARIFIYIQVHCDCCQESKGAKFPSRCYISAAQTAVQQQQLELGLSPGGSEGRPAAIPTFRRPRTAGIYCSCSTITRTLSVSPLCDLTTTGASRSAFLNHL